MIFCTKECKAFIDAERMRYEIYELKFENSSLRAEISQLRADLRRSQCSDYNGKQKQRIPWEAD